MGKAWAHGLVPYVDIFEQKGPLLYFIFMLGYCLSPHSFHGIFVFEVISFTVCLYYCAKIIELYLSRKYSYYLLPLFSSILTSSIFFVHGGSAEELCLPMLMITLFHLLTYFKEGTFKNHYLVLFINGFFAGMVAMMKFTLLGFWGAFMISIFCSMIYQKKIKEAIFSCFAFLAGMFIPIVLFAIYFVMVHGFMEFIETYILFNITNYAEKVALLERFKKIWKAFYGHFSHSFILFNLIDIGLIYFLLSKKLLKSNSVKAALLSYFVLGCLGVYWGYKDFPYYFLIIVPFILFGLISLFYQCIQLEKMNLRKQICCFILIIIISGLQLLHSNNLYYMKNKKEDLVQYRFAQIINQKDDATLLNYGFLDGGFYFASDILPSTKYFMALNANVPSMYETLTEDIRTKKYDFIVIRSYASFDPTSELILEHYNLVTSQKEVLEEIEFTYSLYEKKEDI